MSGCKTCDDTNFEAACGDEGSLVAEKDPIGPSLHQCIQDVPLVEELCPPPPTQCITPTLQAVTTCVSSCGCSTPASCTCNQACVPVCNPTPYYARSATLCPENSVKKIYVEKVVGAIKNTASFAMPACGNRIRVVFSSVGEVPIGSSLWAYGLGYLTVTSSNAVSGELELENECPTSNCGGQSQASPGTVISACTPWLITPPQCSGASGSAVLNFPYLAAGFTAPASGDCIDAAVTNVNGLAVGKNVSIQGGTYRLDAIKSATLITICNDGSGIAPGTVVNYQDSQGNYITPITLIDSNPCTNTPTATGKLIVCSNGAMYPLLGTTTGQIPVYDAPSGTVNFRSLAVDTLDCTNLTASLTLDPTFPSGTAYLTSVASSALLTVGDLAVINLTKFAVSQIVSGTQIRLIPTNAVVAIQTYPIGSSLCKAGCCDALSLRVLQNQAPCGKWMNVKDITVEQLTGAATVLTPGTGFLSAIWSIPVQNESCVFAAKVSGVVAWDWYLALDGATNQFAEVEFQGYSGVPQMLSKSFVDGHQVNAASPDDTGWHVSTTYPVQFTVPASTTTNFEIRQRTGYLPGGTVANGVTILNQVARVGLRLYAGPS